MSRFNSHYNNLNRKLENVKSTNYSNIFSDNKSDYNNQKIRSSRKIFSLSLVLILLFSLTLLSNAMLVHAQASETFGGLISSISIYDSTNKIHKIISGKESQFNIDVVIGTDGVKTSEVVFSVTNVGKDYNFKSCTNVGTTSKCYLSVPVNDLGQGKFDYLVIYNPSNLPQVSESGSFVIDGASPIVKSPQIISKGGKLEATFNIEDYAQSNLFCAGVKRVEASTDANFGTLLGSKDYPPLDLTTFSPSNSDLSNCVLNGEKFEFNSPSTGTHTIYIRAIDRVNNKPLGGTPVQVTVDSSKPILDDSLGKFDFFVNGIKQTAFSPGTKQYSLSVYVIENSGISSASLDLSQYNQGTRQGSCSKSGNANDKFTCTWTNIVLDIQGGNINIELPVKILDNSGNELSERLVKNTNIDSQGPSITDIKFVSGTGDFIGNYNNTLIATIKDSGVGVNNQSIYADLSSFGKGNSKPDECKDDICYWKNLNSNLNLGKKVSLSISANDLFGNINSVTKEFNVDLDKPSIGTIIQNVKFPYSGMRENLVFNISVSDATGVARITADFSSISSLSSPVEGVCNANGVSGCTVTLPSNTILSKHKVANVIFTLYDNAGNSVIQTKEVEVVVSSDSPIFTNLFQVKVGEFVPKAIDRRIASQSLVEVMLPLTFEQIDKNGNARIAKKSIVPGECNVVPSNALVMDTPRIIGQYGEQSYLVFPVKLDKVSVKALTSLQFNCTISLLAIEGDTLYTTPQTTQILVDGKLPEIQLYNNPLGDPGEAVINKLKDIKKTVSDWGGDNLRTIETFLDRMRKVCDVMKGIDQFYTAVEGLKGPIYGVALILEPVGGLGEGVWSTYLTLECTTRVTKETFWPSAGEFNYEGWQGVIGGSRKEGSQASTLFGYDVGGYARRACSVVYCTQCSQGFGFADDLANLGSDTILSVPNYWSSGNVGKGAGLPEDPSIPEGERQRILDKSAQAQFDKDGNEIKAPDLSYLAKVNLEANVDPYKNYVTALGCACAPALISHADRYQQLQCIRAKCISDRAKFGLPIDSCEQEFAYNECVYFKGGYVGNLLFAVGIPWIQTMVEKVYGFVAEPGRLAVATFDKLAGCDQWKKATDVAMRGTGDSLDARGTATKLSGCFTEANNREPLKNVPGVTQAILCGGLDVVVTYDSFNHFKDNAIKPLKDYGDIFDQGDKVRIDYCKDAFVLLDEYESQKAKQATSQPVTQPQTGN